jgi:hypothetical protein
MNWRTIIALPAYAKPLTPARGANARQNKPRRLTKRSL